MPRSEADEQILRSLERLSPEGRRQTVLRLIAGPETLDRIVDRLQPGIIELAEQRGLNWASCRTKTASVSWTTCSTSDP